VLPLNFSAPLAAPVVLFVLLLVVLPVALGLAAPVEDMTMPEGIAEEEAALPNGGMIMPEGIASELLAASWKASKDLSAVGLTANTIPALQWSAGLS